MNALYDLQATQHEHRVAGFVHLMVCCLVFSVPLEGLIVLPGIGSLSVLVGVVVTATAVVVVLAGEPLRPLRREHALLACYVFLCGFSIAWSEDPSVSVGRFVSFLQLWILLWLVWQFSPGKEEINQLLLAYVLAACIVASTLVHAAAMLDLSWMRGSELRVSAFGINPNEQALGLVIAVPMAAFLMCGRKGIYRALMIAAVPLLAIGVILTLSRGAFLSLIIALLFALAILRRGGERTIAGIYVASALVSIAVIVYTGLDRFLVRVLRVFSMISSGDLNARELVWRAGWEYLPDAFFFGVGTGAYSRISGASMAQPFSAHSAYLGVLIETGIVGFLLFFGAIASTLAAAFRLRHEYRLLIFALAVPLAIGVLVTQWEYRKPFWLAVAFALGMVASAQRLTQKQR